MSDISPAIRDAMDESARSGLDWYHRGMPKRAIAEWRRGYAMIPAPVWSHRESTWFEANIGHCLVEVGRYAEARTLLRQALADRASDNAVAHVDAGVAAYELEDLDEARGYFIRAFRLGGEEVFAGYDPAYADSIATLIALEREHTVY